MRLRRGPLFVGAVAAALLLGYLLAWARVDSQQIGRSDFTSTYVGATLLRQGQRDRLYDEALQAPLHARLIAPDTEGNLPFVNPPAAALLAAPLTRFDLATAYRLFAVLQLALVALAVLVALRAAPSPPRGGGEARLAIALAASAGVGSLSLVLLGQWDGFSALGLALAYASWRHGDRARGGAWLALGASLAKPHLALGLAAYLLGRRDRRALSGAVLALAGLAAVSLVAVGPAGCAGFVGAAFSSTGRWPLRSLLGFSGLTGSWLGDTAAAHALAAVGSLAAVTVCAVLGDAVRRAPHRLEAALAGAAALSLLASPHLLGHDLAVLAPVAAWSLAAASARDGAAVPWPGAAARRVLAIWLALTLAAAADLGNDRPAPPGRVVPLVLLVAGVAAAAACGLAPRRARARPAPSAGPRAA